jgi:hypothetical protein
MMGMLLVVVLLLVVMPALLYLVGWGVKRFISLDQARKRNQPPNPGI